MKKDENTTQLEETPPLQPQSQPCINQVKHISRQRRDQLKNPKKTKKQKMQAICTYKQSKRFKRINSLYNKVYSTKYQAVMMYLESYYKQHNTFYIYTSYGKPDTSNFFLKSPTYLDNTIPEKYKPYYATQTYSLKDIWKIIESYKYTLSVYKHTPRFANEFQEFLSYFTFYTRIRYQFKRLILAWSYKCLQKKALNDTDPFTLMPVTQPLILYDMPLRGHWVFDAKPFLEYVESKLMYHEELILEPQMPNHPFTNVPISFVILCDLIYQSKKYHASSWICDAFVEYKGNLRLFTTDFSFPLRKRCLESVLANPHDSNFIYLFHDFLEDQFEYNNIENNELFNMIQKAVCVLPNLPYCYKWRDLFKEYYMHMIAGNTMRPTDIFVRNIYAHSQLYLAEHRAIYNMYAQLEKETSTTNNARRT